MEIITIKIVLGKRSKPMPTIAAETYDMLILSRSCAHEYISFFKAGTLKNSQCDTRERRVQSELAERSFDISITVAKKAACVLINYVPALTVSNEQR